MADTSFFIQVAAAGASVLAAGTAFIAAISSERSRRSAAEAQEEAVAAWKRSAEALQEANDLATSQHREVMDLNARARREPVASVLKKLGSSVLADRLAHRIGGRPYDFTSDTFRALADPYHRELASAQEKSLERSGRSMTLWVSKWMKTVSLDTPAQFFEAHERLHAELNSWVDNPEKTLARILTDGSASMEQDG